MYRTLESEMVKKGVSKKEIADFLDITYGTCLAKFRGASYFTLDEAFAIKKRLETYMPIEELFERFAETA